MTRRILLTGLALLTAAAVAVVAQERGAGVAQGEKLFMARGCYGCHTVGKVGTPIASDLSRIGLKYDEGYLERWLRDPRVQRSTAHMPRIDLAPAEVEAMAAYLSSLR